jgi:hypothetical protein
MAFFSHCLGEPPLCKVARYTVGFFFTGLLNTSYFLLYKSSRIILMSQTANLKNLHNLLYLGIFRKCATLQICDLGDAIFLRFVDPVLLADLKLLQIPRNIIVLLTNIVLKCSDSSLHCKKFHRSSLRPLR